MWMIALSSSLLLKKYDREPSTNPYTHVFLSGMIPFILQPSIGRNTNQKFKAFIRPLRSHHTLFLFSFSPSFSPSSLSFLNP